jgi:hypothetical protein
MDTPKRRETKPVDVNRPGIQRRKIEMKPLEAFLPSRPRRVNHLNQTTAFNSSEGLSDEVAGAWLANEVDAPLSGFERHAAEMIDSGLCHAEDLF